MANDLMEIQEQWDTLAKEPVSPETPTGVSIRFDPVFEEIQNEIQNLENPSANGAVDWEKIVTMGEKILRSQSKDLLVASYVCVGLFQQQGYAGLAVGLRFYEQLVQQWWPQLFPEMKRMKGRINALVWLLEKLGENLEKHHPQPKDRNHLEEISKVLQTFSTTAQEVLAQHATSFPKDLKNFQNNVAYLKGKLEKFEKELISADTPKATPPKPAVQMNTEKTTIMTQKPQEKSDEIQSVDGAYRSLHQTGANLVRAISYLRNQDVTNPLPFRLLRAVTWARLEKPEITNTGNSSLIAPPPSLGTQLQTFSAQGAWGPLLETAEGKVLDFPFWMDLQRLTVRALKELGPAYEQARETVLSELSHLLGRMGDLPNLAFVDGTPLADEDTRQWIIEEVIPKGALPSVSTPQTEKKSSGQLAELQKQVKELLQNKQERQGLVLLQKALKDATTRQDQFHLRLEVAEHCLNMKKWEVGISHLETIEQQIIQFSLEEWDPDATLKASQVMVKAFNNQSKLNGEDQVQMQQWAKETVKRICRLDSVIGMNIEPLKFVR